MSVSTLSGLGAIPNRFAYLAIPRAEYVGRGTSRSVYALSDSLVIKFDETVDADGEPYDGEVGTNRAEWETWQRYANGPFSQYFARCYAIARDGTWLIQERVNKYDGYRDDDRDFAEATLTLPIGDLCGKNYGRRDNGQAVMFDYACPAEVTTNNYNLERWQ